MTMYTLEQAIEIAKMLVDADQRPKTTPKTGYITGSLRPVIVRSRDAGVQFGYLVGYTGSTVDLADARQMWSWTAARGGTLLDCATHGVKAGKFSAPCAKVVVINACAIMDCTDAAVETLKSAVW